VDAWRRLEFFLDARRQFFFCFNRLTFLEPVQLSLHSPKVSLMGFALRWERSFFYRLPVYVLYDTRINASCAVRLTEVAIYGST